MDQQSISPETKLRALEIAERTVPTPYIAGSMSGSSCYQNKDMREVFRRADQVLDWLYSETETSKGLIDRLRTVLCDKP